MEGTKYKNDHKVSSLHQLLCCLFRSHMNEMSDTIDLFVIGDIVLPQFYCTTNFSLRTDKNQFRHSWSL